MVYGVATVVGASPREQATGFAWQELDKVRVKGEDQAVAIFCPVALPGQRDQQVGSELKGVGVGAQGLPPQAWGDCDAHLRYLQRMNVKKYLYRLYAERVVSKSLLPFDPAWDGAGSFEPK